MTSAYRIERHITRQAGPVWRAAASIIRIDTDEPVQQLAAKANGAAEAEANLEAALAEALAQLPPPADWGRDPTVPRLVRRYIELRDALYGLLERGDPGAAAFEMQMQSVLQQGVDALTDTQCIELATPTAWQLERFTDFEMQDRLLAQVHMCELVRHQSTDWRAAHERLRAMFE